MKPIPFSIELWQQGYRPVTRDGDKVTNLNDTKLKPFPLEGKINGEDHAWREYGTWRIKITTRGVEHPYDLFLLPPEDESNEIVVEVKELIEGLTAVSENFQKSKVPPGKYILKPVKVVEMLAEEKAKQLVNNFYRPLGYLGCTMSNAKMWEYAKNRAIESVDMLMEHHNLLFERHPDYWVRVKEAIEKL
jgi:hypothetical protein